MVAYIAFGISCNAHLNEIYLSANRWSNVGVWSIWKTFRMNDASVYCS